MSEFQPIIRAVGEAIPIGASAGMDELQATEVSSAGDSRELVYGEDVLLQRFQRVLQLGNRGMTVQVVVSEHTSAGKLCHLRRPVLVGSYPYAGGALEAGLLLKGISKQRRDPTLQSAARHLAPISFLKAQSHCVLVGDGKAPGAQGKTVPRCAALFGAPTRVQLLEAPPEQPVESELWSLLPAIRRRGSDGTPHYERGLEDQVSVLLRHPVLQVALQWAKSGHALAVSARAPWPSARVLSSRAIVAAPKLLAFAAERALCGPTSGRVWRGAPVARLAAAIFADTLLMMTQSDHLGRSPHEVPVSMMVTDGSHFNAAAERVAAQLLNVSDERSVEPALRRAHQVLNAPAEQAELVGASILILGAARAFPNLSALNPLRRRAALSLQACPQIQPRLLLTNSSGLSHD